MSRKIKEYWEKAWGCKGDIKWMYSYCKKHVWAMVLYTLLGMTGTVVGLMSGLVSKDMVDIITGHKTGELLLTFAMMIGIQLLSVGVSNVSNYISAKITTKVDNTIKADTYDSIMAAEWEALSEYHSGKVLSRWQGDSSVIANGVLSIVPAIINGVFRFISALLVVIRYDYTFAIFTLIGVPISFMTSQISRKKMRAASLNSMEVNTEMSAFTQDSFSDFQNVKALDLLKLYKARLREIQKKSADARMNYQKRIIINSMILALVSQLITYVIYGWGVYRVWSGVITYGTMTLFLGLSNSLSGSAQSLFNIVPSSINILNAVKRLREITELPKEDYSMDDDVKAFYLENKNVGIGISLNDASFNYKNKDIVFENSSLVARPHEIVGLIGPSGGGKTTTLRMLLSIINSKSGSNYIFVDNDESRQIPLTAATRQLMAYVPQGASLFSGTIASNMRNVKEDASDEEIIEALKLAEAWSFVEKLDDGIYSEIKERNAGFSEGQIQRISIARALLKKSPILLLDEATSALDIKTADKVLSNIVKDTYPRTCILTTHKPEVMKLCNRVYVIDEQKIQLEEKE